MKRILQEIFEKVEKEYPKFGSLSILLIFHDGRLSGIEFTKTEKTVLKNEK
jgi:hypothetical protein